MPPIDFSKNRKRAEELKDQVRILMQATQDDIARAKEGLGEPLVDPFVAETPLLPSFTDELSFMNGGPIVPLNPPPFNDFAQAPPIHLKRTGPFPVANELPFSQVTPEGIPELPGLNAGITETTPEPIQRQNLNPLENLAPIQGALGIDIPTILEAIDPSRPTGIPLDPRGQVRSSAVTPQDIVAPISGTQEGVKAFLDNLLGQDPVGDHPILSRLPFIGAVLGNTPEFAQQQANARTQLGNLLLQKQATNAAFRKALATTQPTEAALKARQVQLRAAPSLTEAQQRELDALDIALGRFKKTEEPGSLGFQKLSEEVDKLKVDNEFNRSIKQATLTGQTFDNLLKQNDFTNADLELQKLKAEIENIETRTASTKIRDKTSLEVVEKLKSEVRLGEQRLNLATEKFDFEQSKADLGVIAKVIELKNKDELSAEDFQALQPVINKVLKGVGLTIEERNFLMKMIGSDVKLKVTPKENPTNATDFSSKIEDAKRKARGEGN